MMVSHRTPTDRAVGGAGVGDRGCGGSPAPTEPPRHNSIAEGLRWSLGTGYSQPQGGQEAAELQPQQGPPPLTFGLLGAGHRARGLGGQEGRQHWGQPRPQGQGVRAEKGSQQGKNKTPQDKNPNSPVSPTSAPCSEGHEPPAQPGALQGGRRAGRMQPSGQGWGAARTTIQGWGRRVVASCSWRQGDRGVVWFGILWPKAGEWGDPSLLCLQPSLSVL